jgi:hypothetical protein
MVVAPLSYIFLALFELLVFLAIFTDSKGFMVDEVEGCAKKSATEKDLQTSKCHLGKLEFWC